MKKIVITSFVLFISLSFIAFVPSDKSTEYTYKSNKLKNKTKKEFSSFTESQTSGTTSDNTVWNYRFKTWTDFSDRNNIIDINNVLKRN